VTQEGLRIGDGIERGQRVRIVVDGEDVEAYEGECIAAALLASGRSITRWTITGEARGYFCGMGICHECLVIVEGHGSVRACMTPVSDGLRVQRRQDMIPRRIDA
jgi:D-hydroxyproline dehydrogenase subunit gamma